MAAPTPLSSVPDDVFNCVCLVPPPAAPPSKADLLALLGELWAVAEARFGVSGYIWQRQPLQLAVVQEQEASTPRGGDAGSDGCGDSQWVIKGRLAYGDNVEDEWFAVFLLYQLSSMHDGLVIRMVRMLGGRDGQATTCTQRVVGTSAYRTILMATSC